MPTLKQKKAEVKKKIDSFLQDEILKVAKRKEGRPTVKTPEAIRKLREAFAYDMTIEEACLYADISRTTYFDWVKENKQLSDDFAALRENPVMLARQTVLKGMLVDPELALKYLERKKKLEFSTKQIIENEGTTEVVHSVDEEIKALIENLNKNVLHKRTRGGSSGKPSDPKLTESGGETSPDQGASQGQ